MKRSRRETPEAFEVAPFVKRVLRSLTRRAEEGDTLALEALVQIRAEVDRQIIGAARGLHGFGYSWGEIARDLGISRQAAHQRFGTEPEGAEA